MRYLLSVENVGGEAASGVTIEDVLPPGFIPTAIRGKNRGSPVSTGHTLECVLTPAVTCTDSEPIPTGDFLAVVITLEVSPSAAAKETNVVNVSGGSVNASISEPTDVTSTVAGFGIKDFSAKLEAEDGTEELAAGSHPFAFTTSFVMNTSPPNEKRDIISAGSLKDLEVDLPTGLIGNTQAAPKCEPGSPGLQGYLDSCPVGSQVGVANVVVGGVGPPLTTTGGPFTAEVPVYNVAPSDPKVTAEFGFTVETYPILITASLKGNETVAVHLLNSSETVPILSSSVTIWGVPSASSHDFQRFGVEGPGATSNEAPRPFLTEPTACLGPLTTTLLNADSWQAPGAYLAALQSTTASAIGGCDALSFAPTLSVRPTTTQADAPAGYSVGLNVPQNQQPDGLATPALRDATVTLPLGTALSPSAAGGLEACTNAELGQGSEAPASCPAASQVGTVTVTTPVLADPLHGQLFVAEPECGNATHPTPCGPQQAENGSLFRVFMQIEGPGIRVKLPGAVSANTATGQLSTSFREDPQLPFSSLELNLKDGPRAPLANSQSCGEAQTTSELLPWSASGPSEAATPSSVFNVTGCSSPTLFGPGFLAGTVNAEAGRATVFTTSLTRHDGEQNFASVKVSTPPGLIGMLSKVQPCPEPQASEGTCGPQSEIGHTYVAAGAGSQPFWTSGHVFLTGPYSGAPFGLSIVVPAVAGPYNLGIVIVRAAINVDPRTAAISVTSGPLPQMIDGVPLRVKDIEISIDKPGFMVNPTNCAEQHITGSVAGTQRGGSSGTIAAVSTRFAASGCNKLPFAPKLAAVAKANTSKLNGAFLNVKATAAPGEANIGKVRVELPKQLPSRLTTLQKACRDSVFSVNPALCPSASTVGTARAVTPVLAHPLAGPAYLVSHGGAKFPDLVVVLQGEGITIELDGATTIKNGVTISTFNALPDAPVSSFELALPSGPLSLLTAYLPLKAKHSLCGQKLAMPTILTGQNGAVVKSTTMISVSGCAKHKKVRKVRQKKGAHK